MARTQEEPKSPLPPQTQEKPGLDSAMDPKPRYQAALYKGSGKLDGKAALITGGDSGIGRSVAVAFAREGADIAVVYLEEDRDAEETRRLVEGEGRRCLLVKGDIGEKRFCERAVEQTVKQFARLDVLANNAAEQHRAESIEKIGEGQLVRTFRTNIFSFFFL